MWLFKLSGAGLEVCYTCRVMQSAPIIVVGAGPAGLMAALAAVRAACRVLLMERMPRPGLKLLASGGGRCNLTNTLPIERFMEAFGREGRFLEPALRRMGSQKLREFLADLGVSTFSPDGFHVFPVTQKSQTLLRALETACARAGVIRQWGTTARKLTIEKQRVTGVYTEEGRHLSADAVILATGGKTYPQLSGTTLGYDLARQAGHEVTPLYPALVSLAVRETWPRQCAGATLEQAEIWLADQPRRRNSGSLVFTHEGVSGPAVLDLSRHVTPFLAIGRNVRVRLSLARSPDQPSWALQFDVWRHTRGRKTVCALLDEVLPASVAKVVVEVAGIEPHAVAAQLTSAEQRRLTELLDGAHLTVIRSGGDEHAMVTRGGVRLKQVDPHTLQSRLVKGLFMAGEMLDLDGPCGGYNLQWAFASGWLAGCSAADYVRNLRSE